MFRRFIRQSLRPHIPSSPAAVFLVLPASLVPLPQLAVRDADFKRAVGRADRRDATRLPRAALCGLLGVRLVGRVVAQAAGHPKQAVVAYVCENAGVSGHMLSRGLCGVGFLGSASLLRCCFSTVADLWFLSASTGRVRAHCSSWQFYVAERSRLSLWTAFWLWSRGSGFCSRCFFSRGLSDIV